MKKLFLLACAAGLFAACNNNASNNADSTAVPTDSPAIMEETAPMDTSSMTTDSTTLNNPGSTNPASAPGADSAAAPQR